MPACVHVCEIEGRREVVRLQLQAPEDLDEAAQTTYGLPAFHHGSVEEENGQQRRRSVRATGRWRGVNGGWIERQSWWWRERGIQSKREREQEAAVLTGVSPPSLIKACYQPLGHLHRVPPIAAKNSPCRGIILVPLPSHGSNVCPFRGKSTCNIPATHESHGRFDFVRVCVRARAKRWQRRVMELLLMKENWRWFALCGFWSFPRVQLDSR